MASWIWTTHQLTDDCQEIAIPCDQKDELQRRLRAAREEWYEVKDVPGKSREAKAAEKKVHHIQRSLGDHVAKHGCNRD